jgi:hypothetical protein
MDEVSALRWVDICTLLAAIERRHQLSAKMDILVSWFRNHPYLAALDAYPFLRLFVPKLDRSRHYNTKEHKLADLYVNVYKWPRDSYKARTLLDYAGSDGRNREEVRICVLSRDTNGSLLVIIRSHVTRASSPN